MRNLFIRARAWAFVKVIFLAGLVMGSSTVLIFPVEQHNEALLRLRKNEKLVRENVSEAVSALMIVLRDDPHPLVRQGAAQSLGNYSQNPLVVRVLADALGNDADKSVRYACALSLGLSPTFKALRALEKAADDPDPDLRRQIAYSLKRHRQGANKIKATQLIKKLKRDADASVRLAAQDLP